MASLSSVSGTSSSNSIYGNRNVISGLASGMDTESMIENAVAGIKTKISSLGQKRTKVEWQMESYRNIIDKMVGFHNNYTSYTSTNNLLSPSFFNNAVVTSANGANKDMVTASGKSSSDISILGIKQLAEAARYSISAGRFTGASNVIQGTEGVDLTGMNTVSTVDGMMTIKYGDKNALTLSFGADETFDNAQELADAIKKKLEDQNITFTGGSTKKASECIDVNVDADGKITFSDKTTGGQQVTIGTMTGNFKSVLGNSVTDDGKSLDVGSTAMTKEVSTAELLSGKSMTFTLDGVTKTITLGEFNGNSADPNKDLLDSLEQQLKQAFGTDSTGKAKVEVSQDADKKLQFTVAQGSSLQISSDINKTLGLGDGVASSYLDTGKTLKDLVTLDNSMAVKANLASGNAPTEKKDADGNTYHVDDDGNRVAKDADGSWYRVNSEDKKLYSFKMNGVEIGQYTEDTALETVMLGINSNTDAGVKVSYSKTTNEFVFTAKETGAGGQIDFGNDPNSLANQLFGVKTPPLAASTDLVSETVDGKTTWYQKKADGTADKSTKITDAMVKVTDADGKVAWYEAKKDNDGNLITGADDNLVADTSKKITDATVAVTDANGKVTWYEAQKDDNGNLITGADGNLVADTTKKVSSTTKGKDAVFTASINGTEMELTRSSNAANLDGLNVTLGGTFGYDAGTGALDGTSEAITFTSKSDSDKIVEVVKKMVEDYNEMAKAIKDAYSTMPAQKANKTRYEPLTDDDLADMSETAIKAYNEKAKQGILFADTDLSSLYGSLRDAVAATGNDGAFLRSMGLSTSYSDGLTTLAFDETKFRAALDSDPDKVRDAFTKTKESGSSTDGLMQTLKTTLDNYASTTGASKGILIEKAGSQYAPTSILDNSLKDILDNYDQQITKWEIKLSDQIDRYTTKFSRLEQLIAQMNSQSSVLAGMTGSSY